MFLYRFLFPFRFLFRFCFLFLFLFPFLIRIPVSRFSRRPQIYSEETNGAHAHYREPVPLTFLNLKHICNFLRNSDLSDFSHFRADRSNRSNQIEIIKFQDR